jgi:hypothetical protein
MIYFCNVRSIMTHGIIFKGNSSYSSNILKIQTRLIRAITNCGNVVSCLWLFKKLGILPLQAQYIFSFLLVVIKNKDLYSHQTCTDVHPPTSNLTTFQKGAFYFGIKVFIHLPF